MDGDFVDFSELSLKAQRIFVCIEKILFSRLATEYKVTKEELAFRLQMSVENVKLGLRELKKAEYIIPKNPNSSILRIGDKYKYGGRC
jgi:predicted transcriptional regulator